LVAVVSVAAGCSQEGPPKFYLMGHDLGVTPQPGTATCPSCALKKNFAFGYDAVHGTATTMPSGNADRIAGKGSKSIEKSCGERASC